MVWSVLVKVTISLEMQEAGVVNIENLKNQK